MSTVADQVHPFMATIFLMAPLSGIVQQVIKPKSSQARNNELSELQRRPELLPLNSAEKYLNVGGAVLAVTQV